MKREERYIQGRNGEAWEEEREKDEETEKKKR